MKHIRMKATAADPEKTLHAGKVYTVGSHVSPEEAKQLVAGGYAEAFSEQKKEAGKIETAEAPGAPETAAHADKPEPQDKGKKSDKGKK